MAEYDELIGRQVTAEILLPDGSISMYIGKLLSVNQSTFELIEHALVDHTGDRQKFYHGKFDSECSLSFARADLIRYVPRWGTQITAYPFDVSSLKRR